MKGDEVAVPLDTVLGWAVDQGAFLPTDLPVSEDAAIAITAAFYSKLRALLEQADEYSLLNNGIRSVIREGGILHEICEDNGISVPPGVTHG